MRSEGQKQSQKHEKRIAKAVGGQTTAASGAFWSRKGDIRSTSALWEHKYTSKDYYQFKSSELKKIQQEAIVDGRVPVFGVHFGGENYVVLHESDYHECIK